MQRPMNLIEPTDSGINNVGQKMTLKPNYLRGFLKTVGWFYGLIILMSGVIPYFRGQPVDWPAIASIALFGSAFLGVAYA